jgi:hypothetical protein
MSQTELHFEPIVYQKSDGTQVVFQMNDCKRIELILKELSAIYRREDNRPLDCLQFPYHAPELILEAIGLLERATEWDEPTDNELTGEPPITADEIHTAAWKEHQEAHR